MEKVTETITQTWYVTKDGVKFGDEETAKEHELTQERLRVHESITKKRVGTDTWYYLKNNDEWVAVASIFGVRYLKPDKSTSFPIWARFTRRGEYSDGKPYYEQETPDKEMERIKKEFEKWESMLNAWKKEFGIE